MTTRPPAEIGMPLDEVDTPRADRRSRRVRAQSQASCRARCAAPASRSVPTRRSHKCPGSRRADRARLRRHLLPEGRRSRGWFVAAGIRDILVTNEIVGPRKCPRLTNLARKARSGCWSTMRPPFFDLGAAARARRAITLRRAGRNRRRRASLRCRAGCGRGRVRAPNRRAYAGVCAFAASTRITARRSTCARPTSDAAAIAGAALVARETKATIEARRHCVPGRHRGPAPGPSQLETRRAGCTPSSSRARTSSWMPITSAIRQGRRPDPHLRAKPFVWATVMSRPAEERAIVDAGLKALGFDWGPPMVWDERLASTSATDEHGVLTVASTASAGVGDQIWLVPGHCDPTVNLYDCHVGVRGTASRGCGRSRRGARCTRLQCG